jgi:hypothetical protein
MDMEALGSSELADAWARVYAKALLSLPVVATGGGMELSVWPNPVRSDLNIGFTLSEDDRVVIRLVDVTGRMVRALHESQLTAGDHTLTTDVSALPAGTYYLEVSGDQGREVRKVVTTR